VRLSGLGRNVVTQRVSQLIDIGLVSGGELGPSIGGRAPRVLQFEGGAGHVSAAEIEFSSLTVGVSDLSGRLLATAETPALVTEGPKAILGQVRELFDELRSKARANGPMWGVGVGLPGPVEFASGRVVSPPIMPGWDGFSARRYFTELYDAPVWVDNEVNLMALGEHRAGVARAEKEFVFVKIGTGIGANLVSRGQLHRGAQGCAGDIGHVAAVPDSKCYLPLRQDGLFGGGGRRLGNRSRWTKGGSQLYLAEMLQAGRTIEAIDVAEAADHGDPVSLELLMSSARHVGETLARIVNFFNPSMIVIGGTSLESRNPFIGDPFLSLPETYASLPRR
jgi:predicted NBD/HSP70 family sugar kinase